MYKDLEIKNKIKINLLPAGFRAFLCVIGLMSCDWNCGLGIPDFSTPFTVTCLAGNGNPLPGAIGTFCTTCVPRGFGINERWFTCGLLSG